MFIQDFHKEEVLNLTSTYWGGQELKAALLLKEKKFISWHINNKQGHVNTFPAG